MLNEEEILCQKCGVKCEESLMLSCDHNLCMNSAAGNLVRNENLGINNTQYVICDICKVKTEIDTNTSKEVLSMGLNNPHKNKNYLDNINIDNIDNINKINNLNSNE